MDKDKNIEWVEVDIQSLANCLSEEDWKKITNGKTDENLYETIVTPLNGEENQEVKVEKQIRGVWATLFFDIKNQYINLIRTFSKKAE